MKKTKTKTNRKHSHIDWCKLEFDAWKEMFGAYKKFNRLMEICTLISNRARSSRYTTVFASGEFIWADYCVQARDLTDIKMSIFRAMLALVASVCIVNMLSSFLIQWNSLIGLKVSGFIHSFSLNYVNWLDFDVVNFNPLMRKYLISRIFPFNLISMLFSLLDRFGWKCTGSERISWCRCCLCWSICRCKSSWILYIQETESRNTWIV